MIQEINGFVFVPIVQSIGMVEILKPDENGPVKIPGVGNCSRLCSIPVQVLKHFVANHVREKRIDMLEAADTDQILGIKV